MMRSKRYASNFVPHHRRHGDVVEFSPRAGDVIANVDPVVTARRFAFVNQNGVEAIAHVF